MCKLGRDEKPTVFYVFIYVETEIVDELRNEKLTLSSSLLPFVLVYTVPTLRR